MTATSTNMSTDTLRTIKKLVGPYMVSMEVQPSDDGPHLVGVGQDGALHDFLTVDNALGWANEQYYQRNIGNAASPVTAYEQTRRELLNLSAGATP
jgi:hypothetical protein